MKVFITFGSSDYYPDVHRICQEARAFPFDKIYGCTDLDLKQDHVFWKKHGDFVSQNPKGYGFWIWKPYLILKKLQELQDGDILVYADCGCEFNPQGMERFQEYLDVLEISEHGILSFQMNHLERNYTKRAILDHFQNDGHTGQYMATIILLRKTSHSEKIMEEWNKHMKYELIDDSHQNEYPEFRDNRHDQSIYSMVVKKYGSVRLPDETYYEDWSKGKHIPILAKRNRYG